MTVQKTVDRMTSSIARIQKQLDTLPQKAADYWKSITPVRSGNARRRTSLRGNTIEANYPYAQRLDEGYSKQAPQGMSKPTEKFIQNETRRILRK